ncbi:MAG TPA: site-specific DNA-methyltransferase [Bacteroidia bacterium]|jgi:adenine-specific DNA-methyltransferase
MPTLQWIGKEKIINHHFDVPYRVLEHKYGFTEKGEQSAQINSGNMIIHGDNLEALKALLPRYEGQVKCIYIDPPYNTGNENWVYNDNVNSPKLKKWLGQVVGKESDDFSRHDKWLCMMYPRLKLLHKLLSDDGAIFISIDDNEIANLKLVMDEVFGANNFIEIFSWLKTYSPSNLSHKSKKCLEYVVCYEKKRNNVRYKGLFKTNEADNPLIKSNNQRKTLRFPKSAITTTLNEDHFFKAGTYGTKINEVLLKNDVWFRNNQFEEDLILESKFIWTQENLIEEISRKTKIIFKGKSLAPRYDKANYDPEVPRNLIDANDRVGTTEEGGNVLKEIFGTRIFDYPKSPTLLEYIINFISSPDCIILDSFAGSGTTAQAVLNLNKKDSGNRKFILIEMEPYAETITAERVKRVVRGYEKGEGLGGSFDYFELGDPVFDEDNILNKNLGIERIKEYIWFSETRSSYTSSGSSYLGKHNDTGIYFLYDHSQAVSLDYDTLSQHLKEKAERYIIYADNCLLPESFLSKYNIVFKKIAGDITRF